jgi:cytidylate kinase
MITIAIDGPSGAGKSSVAKRLAAELKIIYLDTGAMYRAAALHAIRGGAEPGDGKRVTPLLDTLRIDIRYERGGQKVFLDGEDVSAAIREHRISKAASDISALPPVRLKLVEMQRVIAEKASVVMDGRDIGTYVLPNADVKFFITAPAAVRALRRRDELQERGQSCAYEDILRDIEARDKQDSERAFAPLRQAADAVLVVNADKTFDDLCAELLFVVQNKIKEKNIEV